MFATVLIEDWELLRLLGGRMHGWIFRGQSDSSWTLKTSLERRARAGLTPEKYLDSREHWILRDFQRRAHVVISSPPPESSRLEWLAIIQHYGGPTRLLDFTHSIYVASFFAVEACWDCDAAVWAVDGHFLLARNIADASKKTNDQLNTEHLRHADQILDTGSKEFDVLQVEPHRLNERMSTQQGVFLFPSNVNGSFRANLAAAVGVDEALFADSARAEVPLAEFADKVLEHPASYRVAKLVLSRRAHEDAIYDLANMNVTAATLFPGLEGYARSLAHHLRMPAFVRYPERIKRQPK